MTGKAFMKSLEREIYEAQNISYSGPMAGLMDYLKDLIEREAVRGRREELITVQGHNVSLLHCISKQ